MSEIQTMMIVGGPEILAEVVGQDAETITVEDALTLMPIEIPAVDDKDQPIIDPRTGKPATRHTLTFFKFGMGHDPKKPLTLNKNALVFHTPHVPAALIRMYQAALGKVVTSGQQGIVVP